MDSVEVISVCSIILLMVVSVIDLVFRIYIERTCNKTNIN